MTFGKRAALASSVVCIFIYAVSAPAASDVTADASTSKTQTIVVTDQLVDPGSEIRSIYFNHNEEFGKAWVEVVMDNTRFPDSPADVAQVLMKDLSYDKVKQQVILEFNGKNIDCADLEPPTWYRWASKLIPTGACDLKGRIDIKSGHNDYGDPTEATVIHVDMDVTSN